MKKIAIIVLLLTLAITSNGYAEEHNPNELTPEDVVSCYYNALIDIYNGADYNIINDYLDGSSVQCMNIVTAIRRISFAERFIRENYGKGITPSDFSYQIDFRETIFESSNMCSITLRLTHDTSRAYPPFLINGEELFKLKKIEGMWRIYEHQYDGLDLFETSTSVIREFDENAQANMIRSIYETQPTPELEQEMIMPGDSTNDESGPGGAGTLTLYYNPARAVSYGVDLTVSGNSLYYQFPRDCTNFASQCISYGFGSSTNRQSLAAYVFTPSWGFDFNHPDLSPLPWIGVYEMYSYMRTQSGCNLSGYKFVSNSNKTSGGIAQIYGFREGEGYIWKHTVLLFTDAAGNWCVAQHSPNQIMSLSSVLDLNIRYFTPVSITIY